MKLDEIFSVESDSNSWILKKHEVTGKKEDGKDIVSKDTWYYPTLKLSLMKYLDECCKPSKSIQEILNRLSEVEDTVEKLTLKK